MIRRSLLALPALVLLGAGVSAPSYAQNPGYYFGGDPTGYQGGSPYYGGRSSRSPYIDPRYSGSRKRGGYDTGYRDGYYDGTRGKRGSRQERELYRRQTQTPNYVDPQNPPGP